MISKQFPQEILHVGDTVKGVFYVIYSQTLDHFLSKRNQMGRSHLLMHFGLPIDHHQEILTEN